VMLDLIRQEPGPGGALLQGLFFGRVAPPRSERRTFEVPTLVLGHPRDPVHPFSDAGELASEMPNARLVEANSLVELRLQPDRLTDQIADFLHELWVPGRRRRAGATSKAGSKAGSTASSKAQRGGRSAKARPSPPIADKRASGTRAKAASRSTTRSAGASAKRRGAHPPAISDEERVVEQLDRDGDRQHLTVAAAEGAAGGHAESRPQRLSGPARIDARNAVQPAVRLAVGNRAEHRAAHEMTDVLGVRLDQLGAVGRQHCRTATSTGNHSAGAASAWIVPR